MHTIHVLRRAFWFCSILYHLVGATPVVPQNGTLQWSFAEIPPSKALNKWYPCFNGFLCAVLDVPLDYHKPSGARSFIPLIKYPAKIKPYKGMVLANPGGPGVSGVDLIRSLATQNIPFFGLDYDFVSWDVRGSGFAIPPGNCALSPNLAIPLGPAVKRRALDQLYGPSLPGAYFDGVYKVAHQVGQDCSSSIGGINDAGPHMSTATVARDMISVLDAYARSDLGKGCVRDASLLNYWGISYGTHLGQTFASMFPSRVGRLLLDGVLDPDETAKESGLNMVGDADKAFAAFFLYCNLAGPAYCPFYTGTTPHDIFLRFEAIVSQLNATQALEQNWSNATAIWIVLQGLKGILSPSTYHAVDDYPQVGYLLPLVEGLFPDITIEKVQYLQSMLPNGLIGPISVNDTWSTGCACADNGGRYLGKKPGDWANTIPILEKQSWLSGESQIVNQMFCSGWNITSVERYGGPFGGKTKNPIVFLSNTLDPITPIVKFVISIQTCVYLAHQRSGRKGVRIFKDAQLITIEGIGHTSLTTKNVCSLRKIGAFLINGTYPGKDNYCPLEAGPWGITIPGPLTKRTEITEIAALIKGL